MKKTNRKAIGLTKRFIDFTRMIIEELQKDEPDVLLIYAITLEMSYNMTNELDILENGELAANDFPWWDK